MISLELNDTVVLEQQQVLEQALSTNPKTQKALQKLIRQVIMEARTKVSASASSAMKSDPRGSSRAVRTSVYKKILGANINIYNSRKAHGSTSYEPARKLRPGQRGGNRVPRGGRTAKIMGYEARDRGFILRFINSGTDDRYAGFGRMGNTASQRKAYDAKNSGGKGFRGRIAPRNFFRGAAERALVQATDVLANLIDTELENILNKKK